MAIIWVSFVRSRVGTKILETLKPVSSNPSASSLFAKASRACSSAAKRSAVACACFENGEKFYLEGLAIDPKHVGINEYLGELYVATGRHNLAVERLEVLAGCNCKEYDDLKAIIAGKKVSKY